MKKKKTVKVRSHKAALQRLNPFTPPRIEMCAELTTLWATNTAASIFAKPRPKDSLGRAEMKQLLRASLRRLIIAANADHDADHEKWKAALGLLHLKVEVGHGCVLAAMDAVNTMCAGKIPVRTANLRARMLKGYIAHALGEPVTISILRRQPTLFHRFDFKKFYKALDDCGSQKVFLETYCGQPATADTNEAGGDTNELSAFEKKIASLLTGTEKLAPNDLPAAAQHANLLVQKINSRIQSSANGRNALKIPSPTLSNRRKTSRRLDSRAEKMRRNTNGATTNGRMAV